MLNISYRKYEDYHKTINGMEYKQCKKCKEWFIMNQDNFRKNNSNRDKVNDFCIVCQKENNKNYYSNNKEYLQDEATKYYYEHRDDRSVQRKQYYQDNMEQEKLKMIVWRENNKEDIYNYTKEYQKANPDKMKKYRIEREMHKEHDISEEEWIKCKNYFNYQCSFCGMPEENAKERYNNKLHKEHAINNGSNQIDNCIPACKSCNSKKRKLDWNVWFIPKNKLFNQERYTRIERWLNSFMQ